MLWVALAVSLPFWTHPKTKGAAIERHRLDKWTYEIATDRFTGRRGCVVRRGDVSLSQGVLTVRFKPSLDTTRALYRIDAGEARPVSDFTLELRRMGATPMVADNLANPSGGLVRVPFAKLRDARTLAIRVDAGRSARRLKLAGLAAAAAAAAADGCDPAHAQ